MELFQFLLLPSLFLLIEGSDLCEENCNSLYGGNLSEKLSCSKGCNFSKHDYSGSTDASLCNSKCAAYSSENKLRAPCYEGCMYVQPTQLSIPWNNNMDDGIFDWLKNFLYKSGISRLSNSAEETDALKTNEDHPVITVIRFRSIVPIYDSEDFEAGREDRDKPDSVPVVQHFSDDSALIKSRKTVCRMFRSFSGFVFSNPLTFALSFFLLVTLLSLVILSCLRCRLRRQRAESLKRQMEKMPAYFEPASIKINIASPQPTNEKEKEVEELLRNPIF